MEITLTPEMLSTAVKKQGRVNRNPKHTFNVAHSPWEIQPFLIAPVLPGETMKNLLLQSRAITDPIKNPIMGWHLEYYIFYVKLRDLDNRDEIVTSLMTPGDKMNMWTNSGYTHGYDAQAYGHGLAGKGGPNFTRRCLDRVVAEYFTDEDEAAPVWERSFAAGGNISPGLPIAKIKADQDWTDSAKLESFIPTGEGQDEMLGQGMHDEHVPAGFEAHFEQYQHMRSLKMVDVTFADWLKQFGVNAPKADKIDSHRPELLRYIKDWSYPSNTVDPVSGTPSSAVSWSIAERADKDRYFNEPGFIFGVTVSRPKIYIERQKEAAVNMLNDAFSWLPAIMGSDPYTSLRRFATDEGPYGDDASFQNRQLPEAYWVDVRDLFLYGDQFLSVHDGQMDRGKYQSKVLGEARPRTSYATFPEMQALFKNANLARVRQDGVVNLTIAGTQRDHT